MVHIHRIQQAARLDNPAEVGHRRIQREEHRSRQGGTQGQALTMVGSPEAAVRRRSPVAGTAAVARHILAVVRQRQRRRGQCQAHRGLSSKRGESKGQQGTKMTKRKNLRTQCVARDLTEQAVAATMAVALCVGKALEGSLGVTTGYQRLPGAPAVAYWGGAYVAGGGYCACATRQTCRKAAHIEPPLKTRVDACNT